MTEYVSFYDRVSPCFFFSLRTSIYWQIYEVYDTSKYSILPVCMRTAAIAHFFSLYYTYTYDML